MLDAIGRDKDKGSHQIYLEYLFMNNKNVTEIKNRLTKAFAVLFVHIRIFAIEYERHIKSRHCHSMIGLKRSAVQ